MPGKRSTHRQNILTSRLAARGPHAWREVLTALRDCSLAMRAPTPARPASHVPCMPFPVKHHPTRPWQIERGSERTMHKPPNDM